VLFVALLASLRAASRSRLELAAEILALRHQLAVLQRTTPKRPLYSANIRQKENSARNHAAIGSSRYS